MFKLTKFLAGIVATGTVAYADDLPVIKSSKAPAVLDLPIPEAPAKLPTTKVTPSKAPIVALDDTPIKLPTSKAVQAVPTTPATPVPTPTAPTAVPPSTMVVVESSNEPSRTWGFSRPCEGAHDWSGFYFGGNVGRMGDKSGDNNNLAPVGNYLQPTGAAAPPNAAGTGDFPANLAALTNSILNQGSGGTYGLQIGVNHQSGKLVLGLEADIQWNGFSRSADASYPAFPNLGNPVFTNAAHTEHVSTKLDWYTTYRGRWGIAFDRVLCYATGGLAVGRISSDAAINFGNAGAAGVYNNTSHIGSYSTIALGWTGGAGLEYAINDRWSMKAEYLLIDLGTYSYAAPIVAPPAAANQGYNWFIGGRERDHVVRFGINRKF